MQSETENLQKSPYQVTLMRIVIALILGATVGGVFQAIDYAMHLHRTLGEEHFEIYGVQKTKNIFILTSIVWLIGLVIIACPVWYVMHTKQKRSILYALLVGFLCPFLFFLFISTGYFTGIKGGSFSAGNSVGLTWENGRITFYGLTQAFKSSFWMGLQGLVIAVVIWRVAYRYNSERI